MAAKQDTPAERRRRDKVEGRTAKRKAAKEPEVAQRRRIYGRVVPQGEQVALVASAARINLNDRKQIENARRRRQAWQSESWDYYDEIGETGFTVDFGGNLMAKARLYAAVRPEANAEPMPVDDPDSGVDADTAKICVQTLERLRSREGGQSALIREATINLDVAGEFYLHGHEDPETGDEDWQIRSVDELVVTGDSFALRAGPGYTSTDPIPADDLVVRMWQRHPRFSQLATCAMRRVLGEAESLLLLSREIRATSKSRLSAGLLLMPTEISFGGPNAISDPSDGEGGDDPFEDELTTAMVTPIQQEGSAGAVVPLVVRAPADYLAAIRHIDLQKQMDPTLDSRIEGRVLRIARGLNFPVETTTGLQATTFANAATVKKSEWDAHGQPRAVLLVDAFTAGYFQPALEEAGVAPERVRDFFVWFDPSDAISAPDPVDHVEKAHEDGIISDATRRRVQGYSEADAPDDLELLRRIIFHSPRLDPFILGQLLKITGLVPNLEIPAPQNGVLDADGAVITPALPVAAAAALMLAAGPAARRSSLGRRLVDIDRDLRTRAHTAAEATMARALERAGNRIKSKAGRTKTGEYSTARRIAGGVAATQVAAAVGRPLVAAIGLTDLELLSDSLDGFVGDFGTWVAVAQTQAINAVEQIVGPLDQAVREALATAQVTNREAAVAQLTRRMMDLAGARLYDPLPGATLGEATASTVPMSLIREALAIAGGQLPQGGPADGATTGAPLTDDNGRPLGGVASGSDIMGVVQGEGGGVEGYEWDYGGADRNPFFPHMDLDGTSFVNFDDDVLANNEDFPDVEYLFPGDHDGCFPAGTIVSGPAPRGATLRWYEGPLVELAFASGQFLSATANHPVLTDCGWVPAQLLDEGDHVVRCLDAETIAALVPGDHQTPALIEEVVGSFGERLGVTPRRVEIAAEHFHGDGAGSEVATVWTDRHLSDGGDAALQQPAGQPLLVGTDPDASLLAGKRSGAELLPGVRSAPLGLEGVGGDLAPPLGRPGRVGEPLSLADAPDYDAALPEPLGHSSPVHAEVLGQSLEGLAGGVQLDKVINIRRVELWTGHVYNLETSTNWYMANGILVRNCVCDFVPTIVFVPAGDMPEEPAQDSPPEG